jgi:hypothetical protein
MREGNEPIDDVRAGLYGKYRVARLDGSSAKGGKHEHCRYFVLDLAHDGYSFAALKAYADACRVAYPQLSADLEKLLR